MKNQINLRTILKKGINYSIWMMVLLTLFVFNELSAMSIDHDSKSINIFEWYTETIKTVTAQSLNTPLVYVDVDATGNNDGTSWANAYNNLQDGIDNVSIGGEVWVAEGTYLPTADPLDDGTDPRRRAFHANFDFKLYGGFDGTETSIGQRDIINHPTILSGDFNQDDVVSGSGYTFVITNNNENAKHVMVWVNQSNAAIMDGITIAHGYAREAGNNDNYSYSGISIYDLLGGGLAIYYSDAQLENCTFQFNEGYYGGGITSAGTNLSFRNCLFDRNVSNDWGAGGMMQYSIYGGCNDSFLNCVFSQNDGYNHGAGYLNGGGGNISTFRNCIFDSNDGTAIYGYANGIINVYNSTFNNNSSDFLLQSYSSTDPTVLNAINCVIGGNTGASGSNYTYNVTHSLIANSTGFAGNTGVINEMSPNYVDAFNPKGADGIWMTADDGLRLGNCSPAHDAGDGIFGVSVMTETMDAAGQTRFYNGSTVDMGAYEKQEDGVTFTITGTTSPETCPGTGGGITLSVSDICSTPTYLWSNGSTDQNLSNVASGTYTVTATDAAGTSVTYTNIVDPYQSTAEVALTLGNGTYTSGNESHGFMPSEFSYAKIQFLFLNSELQTMGLLPGDEIVGVEWNVEVDNSPEPNTFDIYITDDYQNDDLPADTTFVNNLTSVATSVVDAGQYTGWHRADFGTNWVWDGTDNIVLQNCRQDGGQADTDVIREDYSSNRVMTTGYAHPCTATQGFYVRTHRPQVRFIVNRQVANVRYVDVDATGSNDGSSWSNAYNNLQDALDAACEGGEIWVAEGTYYPTSDPIDNGNDSRDFSFHMDHELKVYGGFDGTETMLSERDVINHPTILSGDFNQDDTVSGQGTDLFISNSSENAYHVFVISGITGNPVIDGLVIQNGNADAGSNDSYSWNGPVYRDLGGGLYLYDTDIQIRNCTFQYNYARHGGGVSSSSTNTVVEDCIFDRNIGTSDGGGYCMYFGFSGGPDSYDTFNNCVFTANKSNSGALDIMEGNVSDINNSIFYGNQVSGLEVVSDATCNVHNSTFLDNSISVKAYGYSSSGPTTINVVNCILGNQAINDNQNNTVISVSHSLLIESSDYAGINGNINNQNANFMGVSNPQGADGIWMTADDGLRLGNCSPAENAGDGTSGSSVMTKTTDIAGQPRFYNGSTVDMGAYEYQSASSPYCDMIPFVTTWKTDNPGTSNSSSITLPLEFIGTVNPINYDVDWDNDGIYDDFGLTGLVTHDYGTPGTYQVAIRGQFPQMQFWNTGDKDKILSIDQWGEIEWHSFTYAYNGCTNLVCNATDTPDLSNCASFFAAFFNATSFAGDLSAWDVSTIDNMRYAFAGTSMNSDISGWDVSNVIDMLGMFQYNNVFNQDISGWNVSSLQLALSMFQGTSSFDQNLGNWNISSVTSMYNMLSYSNLSISNYDNTLIGWASQNVSQGLELGAYGLKYSCIGEPAWNDLTNNDAWTINDDGLNTIIATTTVDANISCNGAADGQMTINVTDATPPYTYDWGSGPSTDAILTGLSDGNYIITVTDANGCTATTMGTITQPEVLTISVNLVNDVSCFGNSDGSATAVVNGGTAPYTFLWSNNETTVSAINLSVGIQTVQVTDANGCTVTENITISSPSRLAVSTDVTNHVLCSGNADGAAFSAVTGGTFPYSYLWSNGAVTPGISDVPGGVYQLTITDANGCTDNSTVVINEPNPLLVTHQTNNITCNGDSDGMVTTQVTGGVLPYTYNWSTGATTTSIGDLSGGAYTLSVTDANNCEVIIMVDVVEPDPLMATVNLLDGPSCVGSGDAKANVSVTGGTAPYTYLWTDGTTTPNIKDMEAGVYAVAVKDANGCIAPAALLVEEPAEAGSDGDIYVDASATGANDGSSWENAYTDLQDAMMGGYYRTIHIAEGTYKPSSTDQSESFELLPGMMLLGGYPMGGGTRDADTYTTILSGDIDGDGSYNGNAFHVVTADNSNCAMLDGLTIKQGSAIDTPTSNVKGGGIYVNKSDITIVNVNFRWNRAEKGGAIFATLNSVVTIESSSIQNCKADYGSAMFSINNSSLIIRQTEMMNNNAGIRSVIEAQNAKLTRLENSIIANNAARNSNGIRVTANSKDHTLELMNSTLTGDVSDQALLSLQVKNGVALTANFYNSIISHQDLSSVKLVREYGTGIMNIHSENCYIQGDDFTGTTVDNSYSDVVGDVLFNADFSLSPCSPAANGGNDTYVVGTEDFAGNPRIFTVVDMGAFESQVDCIGERTMEEDAFIPIAEVTNEATYEMTVSPNPTVGMIEVKTNVDDASIFIFDATGTLLQQTTQNEVDLSNYPTGLYMVVVELDGQLIGTEKVMKR